MMRGTMNKQLSADRGQARRACPNCGTLDDIAAEARLWPSDWKCPNCAYAPSRRGQFVRLAPDLDDLDEGFALESFDILERSEEAHFWFTTRNQLIEWLIDRYASTAARAIEIGCGTGFVLKAFRSALPRANIAGSELHSRGLHHALDRHTDHVELVQMDARQTFLSGAFELVGAFDVLEHIDEDELVLAEIFRMLRPNGVFIASVPQHPWLWSAVDKIAHHRRRYRRGELAAKARNVGFRIRYQTSFATLAFPMLMADRLRSGQGQSPESADLAVPRIINLLMLALFRFEHLLRRLGVPLPFGGSQIIVADKV